MDQKSSEPPVKKPRIADEKPTSSSVEQLERWQWNDEYVGCEKTGVDRGIRAVKTFQGIRKSESSIEDIKHQINNHNCYSFWGRNYIYYSGFKKGLTTLLSAVHERNIGYRALLIHGGPKIGKSCLALNLAYYLAYKGQGYTSTVVVMDNSNIFNPDEVTSNICDHIVDHSQEWVILDQCNVNNLNKVDFIQCLTHSGRKTPVIIFTSGDFQPPCPSWTNDRVFSFKVIDMRVDEKGVEQVKDSLGNTKVEAKDVLQVIEVMGHVLKCVLDTREDEEPVTLSRMLDSVYEITELSYALSHDPSVLWLIWPKLCSLKEDDIAKMNKPADWKLEPSQVQLLGFMLSFKSDPEKNQYSRLFINWLRIDGDGRRPDNEDGGFYEHNKYFYYFPFLEKLHGHFKKAYSVSPEEMFKVLNNFYQRLESRGDISARAALGHTFEALIKLKCKVESKKHQRKKGLMWVPSGDDDRCVISITVSDILTPYSETEMCEVVEQKRQGNTDLKTYWFDLNASTKQFKGYDFALVQIKNAKYSLFQLFQATINPSGHSRGMMLTGFNTIQKACGSNFEPQAKIDIYYLCPHGCKGTDEPLTVGVSEGRWITAEVVNMMIFD